MPFCQGAAAPLLVDRRGHLARVYDWILTSGLTQEEIAFAQLPDMPVGPGPDWIDRENQRIVAHLEAVEKKLQQNTAASLTIAVNRLMKAGIPAA